MQDILAIDNITLFFKNVPQKMDDLLDFAEDYEPIKKFFTNYPEVENYIDKIDDLLFGILKAIEQSDRSYLTVAIGCTGGYHRSVYIAQSLADKFQQRGICVKVRHRSLIKSRQNSQKC